MLKSIELQEERDFEVIIVDQSSERFDSISDFKSIEINYIHTLDRGAVKARNKGANIARGHIIAFIDDDCVPSSKWLSNANNYFKDENVVGLEGSITTSKLGNPKYRTVTNLGLEGLAFMTANLFVRKDIFFLVNGFDEEFDSPHFREDTDLGWRMLKKGIIPFAKDVQVYHPPHKRNIKRESLSERNTFFIKDPLLLKKHPELYTNLFIKEEHYIHSEGFWEYFMQGVELYSVDKKYIRALILNENVNKTYIPVEIIKNIL